MILYLNLTNTNVGLKYCKVFSLLRNLSIKLWKSFGSKLVGLEVEV